MEINELSVFFPAYNEEKNIEPTVTKAAKILSKVAKVWEIIVVNDGSEDKTGEIVEKLIEKNKKIRMITHTPNRGYGVALKTGFYNARYEWVAFTDADGQFDFSQITKLIAKQRQTKADLVIGYYLKRKVPLYRIWGSKFWGMAIFLLFGLKVKDIDCGFKLIRRQVIEQVSKLEAERGPFISSELLIKAIKKGFKIAEVGVHHYPRQAGKATGASLKVIFSGLTDLLKLKNKLKKI